MNCLNRLRRGDHAYNLSVAATYRKVGMLDLARKYLGWARFDRDCFERGGWKLP